MAGHTAPPHLGDVAVLEGDNHLYEDEFLKATCSGVLSSGRGRTGRSCSGSAAPPPQAPWPPAPPTSQPPLYSILYSLVSSLANGLGRFYSTSTACCEPPASYRPLSRTGEVDWGRQFATNCPDLAIEKVRPHDSKLSFLILSHIKDHVRVATKLDTLKSKPQDSELPFVSASELRRFPKKTSSSRQCFNCHDQ